MGRRLRQRPPGRLRRPGRRPAGGRPAPDDPGDQPGGAGRRRRDGAPGAPARPAGRGAGGARRGAGPCRRGAPLRRAGGGRGGGLRGHGRATRRPWRPSAGGWTGSPWPSSWRPRACASCPWRSSSRGWRTASGCSRAGAARRRRASRRCGRPWTGATPCSPRPERAPVRPPRGLRRGLDAGGRRGGGRRRGPRGGRGAGPAHPARRPVAGRGGGAAPTGRPATACWRRCASTPRQKLAASGEADATRERHAAYYLALAEQAAPATPAGDVAALDQLEREHANLREALRWWAGRGEAEPGLRAATALSWFWGMRGYRTERREWLARFLALPAAACRRSRARRCGPGPWSWPGATRSPRATPRRGAPCSRRGCGSPGRRGTCPTSAGRSCSSGLCARAPGRPGRRGGLPTGSASRSPARRAARRGGSARGSTSSRPLVGLGPVAALRGDAAAARAHLEDALAVARASGRPRASPGRSSSSATLARAARRRRGGAGALRGGPGHPPRHGRQGGHRRRPRAAWGRWPAPSDDPARAGALCDEALAIAARRRAPRGAPSRARSAGWGPWPTTGGDSATARARLRGGPGPRPRSRGRPRAWPSCSRTWARWRSRRGTSRRRRPATARAWPSGGTSGSGRASRTPSRASPGSPPRARQPERALRLGGAAAALRAATGTRRPPVERARIEAQLQRARRALGSTASLAWAAGEALSPAQAVAEALAALDAAPPGRPRLRRRAAPPAPPPRGGDRARGRGAAPGSGPDRPADRGRAGAERGDGGAPPDRHLPQAGRRLAPPPVPPPPCATGSPEGPSAVSSPPGRRPAGG